MKDDDMTYAVCVTFTLHPDKMTAFMPLMIANARTSLADEMGCVQFDVLTDPDRPDEVFLYELYDDRAAFDAHLGTAHFQAFDAAVGPMIATKDVRTFTQVAR